MATSSKDEIKAHWISFHLTRFSLVVWFKEVRTGPQAGNNSGCLTVRELNKVLPVGSGGHSRYCGPAAFSLQCSIIKKTVKLFTMQLKLQMKLFITLHLIKSWKSRTDIFMSVSLYRCKVYEWAQGKRNECAHAVGRIRQSKLFKDMFDAICILYPVLLIHPLKQQTREALERLNLLWLSW